jgi:trehalose 6-phosphate phosphatase
MAAVLAPDFRLLEGDKVLEIKPTNCTKGTAIDAFLTEAPFAGRTPVFIGDDITDQDGFFAVEHHRGMAIAVGNRVQARWKLADPQAARGWVRRLISAGGE